METERERELGMQTMRDAKIELMIIVWSRGHSPQSCVLGDEFELSRVQHVLKLFSKGGCL